MIIMDVKPLFDKDELFISDLDGTLLNPQSEISPYTRQVLNQVIASGHRFSIASARSCYSILQLFEGIPLNQPIVASNGAVIASPEGQILYRAEIGGNLLLELYKGIKQLGLTPLLSSETEVSRLYYSAHAENKIMSYMAFKKDQGDPRLLCVDDIFSYMRGIITVTLLSGKESMQRAYDVLTSQFSEDLNIYLMPLPEIDGSYTLSITHKDADKGRGLSRLKELIGSIKSVTVFGDHINDLTLFEQADHTIAVANAEMALKEKAEVVIGSNAEDGVARYLVGRLGL